LLLETVTESHKYLLEDETRAYAYLATIMDDGTPQITTVWFNLNTDYILINSSKGRVKDRNMRARPEVALLIQDPNDYFTYLQIRGQVVEITEDGARDHIDQLAGKYTGTPEYKGIQPGMVRVLYKIKPESIYTH
jgi:PPOX class probable F420-dependent enzyme